MNTGLERERSLFSELTVGAIALAAVALITFFGVRTSPPAASPSPASRGPEATASIAVTPPPAIEPARPPVETEATNAASAPAQPSVQALPEPARPTPPPPSLDRVVEYSPAPLVTTNPLVTDSAAASRAEAPSRSRPYEAARAQPPSAAVETMPARDETERDLVNRFDVISIQTKLRELGYYLSESDGVWGPGARRALREFKVMNGLSENDQWDREAEERLWSGRGVPAASTFIGMWARDAAECRNRTGDDQRIKIDTRGAESAGTKCDFRSVNQEAAGRWQVRALCSAGRDLWSANISLKLTGSNLRWSSERGTETYLRCGRVSVISSR
jgi:Putative peptidoglycan binding domain